MMPNPCLLSLQFLLDEGKLSVIANFRAMHRNFYVNDKVFVAKQLAKLAYDLELEVNKLYLNIAVFW